MPTTRERPPGVEAPVQEPQVAERRWARWLWLGLAIVAIVAVVIALIWAVVTEDESVVAAEPDHEVTSVHIVNQDDLVTAAFVGSDANLDPEVLVDYDHEATTVRVVDQDELVTVVFLGGDANLDPDVPVDYDHEVTTVKIVDQSELVTVPFVGVSGELDAEK